ncbi:hypothetical protein GCM10022255_116130 [Dactylosporangium darangshiense]|uniref:Uncharacterized protein n=1 Tax=Dactylosporangium darangshiense TaxID=579108 RepID=A0ABP8DX06_9ACTN
MAPVLEIAAARPYFGVGLPNPGPGSRQKHAPLGQRLYEAHPQVGYDIDGIDDPPPARDMPRHLPAIDALAEPPHGQRGAVGTYSDRFRLPHRVCGIRWHNESVALQRRDRQLQNLQSPQEVGPITLHISSHREHHLDMAVRRCRAHRRDRLVSWGRPGNARFSACQDTGWATRRHGR